MTKRIETAMATILTHRTKTAREIVAGDGGALVMTDAPRQTLAEIGQIYVSLAAAREFARAERITDGEAARRELTELLLDARQSPHDPSLWRMRRRSTGLDISARIKIEGRLYVVTTIGVRDSNVGGRRG